MIWDIGQGLGCFLLLRLGFVFDYGIFLRMQPAILDTLAGCKISGEKEG